MNDLDCFIFIDLSVSEEERAISILCVECHDEKMPDSGVFYQGSKEGYSNYDWVCCVCGKIIHKSENETYEEEINKEEEDDDEQDKENQEIKTTD